jgi:hypothetical protein
MSAKQWKARFAAVRRRWSQAHPHCAERDCHLMRRTWRRMGWWNGSIRLRGSSYCAPKCFESAARECFLGCTPVPASSPVQHRVPLGLLMLSRGQLTHQQLRAALEAQKGRHHQRIGEWLQELGFATEQQVTTALGLQWACPVLERRTPLESSCGRMLPFRLLERFRMLPIQFVPSARIFYVAFCNGIDYTALYAIEQMLDCRTEACLISSSTMDRELERMGHEARAGDLLFESWHDAAAMAHITCGYALKLGAEQVRIVGCGEYIWVRVEAGREAATLLFRHPVVATQAEPTRANHSVTHRVAG